MADQELVIRDDAGQEHVFPPGFDPQKAVAIVKQQTTPSASGSLANNIGPRPIGGYTISDEPEGLVSRTIRGMIHPSPEQQLGMDILPMAVGAIGTPKPQVGEIVNAAGAARTSVQDIADGYLSAFLKRFGGDPDALDLAATKMRLQAARSRTRQATMAGKLAGAATSPAETPVAAAAPPSLAATPAGPATPHAAPASPGGLATDPILKVAADLKRMGFSDAETNQAIQWKQQGVPTDQVIARLKAGQELKQAGPFAHLPTDLEMAKDIAARNATDRWSK